MRIRTLLPLALAAVGALLLVVSVFAGAGSAKASAGKAGAFKRGGTLKVAISEGDFANTDPGQCYDTGCYGLIYTNSIFLLNYPEKNGPAASQLYPEAAQSFPTVSKDGKTYVFTVRKGLKFSDGTPVTAAAFQRAFERSLSPQMGSPYAVNIHLDDWLVGGKDFLNGKTKTLAGVKAKGQVLTIKLVKPIPAFNAILPMNWFAAVKPDTPYSEDGIEVMPSAGPYMVKSR